MDDSPQPGLDLPQGFAKGIKRIHHSAFPSSVKLCLCGAGVRNTEIQKYRNNFILQLRAEGRDHVPAPLLLTNLNPSRLES